MTDDERIEKGLCLNTAYDHPCDSRYLARYGGYCPDCVNAGVPDLADRVAALEAERERLLTALDACDTVMITAGIHGLPQQLPPAYRDSWAVAHQTAKAALCLGDG